jgi:hypothetical protein
MNELKDLLEDLQDYFSNKSDCDGDSEGLYPNKEMMLAQRIGEQLEASPSEEEIIRQLQTKLEGMKEFVAGHFTKEAADGALVSISEIESWCKRKMFGRPAASLRSPILVSDLNDAAYAALDGEKTEGETTYGEEKMFIQGFYKGYRLRFPSEQELIEMLSVKLAKLKESARTHFNTAYINGVVNAIEEAEKLLGSTSPQQPASPISKEETAKLIVGKLGEYVNGLGMRHLGLPMMDEVAVMEMESIVTQILDQGNEIVEFSRLPENIEAGLDVLKKHGMDWNDLT